MPIIRSVLKTDYYVYTVEIPDLTDDNHLFYSKPVILPSLNGTESTWRADSRRRQ